MQLQFSPVEFSHLVALSAAHTRGGGAFGALADVQWPTTNVAERAQILLALREVGALVYAGTETFFIPASLRATLGL